jgi:acyl carrier protein
MIHSQMLHEINRIFMDVLDEDKIIITPETTAADVDEWDSLNHIHLIVAIEKHFKIKFSTQEINNWKTVGDMCQSISEKQAA